MQVRRHSLPCPLAAMVLLVFLAGCGSEDEMLAPPTPGPGDSECQDDEFELAGTCVPVGLPRDMACPPAEVPFDDGSCQPAGVPLDGCGVGFVHDGDRGCEPVLPDEPCGPGLIAVPGDTSCRELSSCGTGTWGNIPTDATTVYVDASYLGGSNDGSQERPFTTLAAAVGAAPTNALIALAAGTYVEGLVLQEQPVRIWGRCASMVEIVAAPSAQAPIVIATSGAGSELHGVALTGHEIGTAVAGATGVVLDSVWIHDTPGRGVQIQDDYGPTEVTIENSLIESCHDFGIAVAGGALRLAASAIRDVAAGAMGNGIGLGAPVRDGSVPIVEVEGSLLARSDQYDLYGWGAQMAVNSSVVREAGAGSAASEALGIYLHAHADVPSTELTLTSSVVERNENGGIHLQGVASSIERTVVRGQLLGATSFGRGAEIVDDPFTGQRPPAMVRSSLFANNQGAGVLAMGIDVSLDGVAAIDNADEGIFIGHDTINDVPASGQIRHSYSTTQQGTGCLSINSAAVSIEATRATSAVGADSGQGSGLLINAGHGNADVTVSTSLFDANQTSSIMVQGGTLELSRSTVRDTTPNLTGQGGHGITLQPHPVSDAAPVLTMTGVLVERNVGFGVLVVSGEATIGSSMVRDTRARSGGEFGDGIVAAMEAELSAVPTALSTIVVDSSVVESSERAAVASFGSVVELSSTHLRCFAFSLSNECYGGACGEIYDGGGNFCGCPAADGACQVASTGIAPPSQL
ncbi:MAG: hypothetical protein JRI23_11540 [Deltaproteobacteria bacterium]|nr:hypothetical protein [Deltaproteobacteria bacterium]MBW2532331.1 hypothetical protein [Deltaproteobacteria bacterium]